MADEAADGAETDPSDRSDPSQAPSGAARDAETRLAPDAAGVRRNRRIGLGMLGSLVLGYGPLSDALSGTGSFEAAIARYLACLGASVGAVLVIGSLLDGAPPEPEDEPEHDPVVP